MTTISYDFIAFSSKTSATSWNLGMRAIQGEVPLDVVIPSLSGARNADNKEIIGTLTTEGTVRESVDGMELYRYLRRLNPRTGDTFGYNEVVIRNIHNRLGELNVGQELQVQITYIERTGPYTQISYNLKLLGIFDIVPPEETGSEEMPAQQTDTPEPQGGIPEMNTEPPAYKTTNTLEKLIVFTQNLQQELTELQEKFLLMTEKIKQLEAENQHHRELQNLLQDIVERLNYLETFDQRITTLEDNRHQTDKLEKTLSTFLRNSHRQTGTLLKEVGEQTEGTNPDI